MKQPVLIMAGGTGGHVFPALAVAGLLRDRREIVWLGTARGIEDLPSLDVRFVPMTGEAERREEGLR